MNRHRGEDSYRCVVYCVRLQNVNIAKKQILQDHFADRESM